jgi:hypothetical protein
MAQPTIKDHVHASSATRRDLGTDGAGNIYKTAIKTPFGLFEWVVMHQDLCNAPATFQRYMKYIFCEYIGEFCDSYMDGIGIYSNSVAEHKKHVDPPSSTRSRH